MEGVHRVAGGEGDQELAEAVNDSRRLRGVLEELRLVIIHRALVAWDRDTEMFGDEIVALNDVEEALRNIRDKS
jgi:hypothetical protein